VTLVSPSAGFPSTAWSCIQAAQDPSHPKFVAAVNRLVTAYWRPVYHFLRAKGHPAPEAEDLTQEFFYQCLVKGAPGQASASRGRFRDFLRTVLKRFAYDQTVRPRQQSRFERRLVSIHDLVRDSDRAYEPAARETPEEAFDRNWKVGVLAAVRESLQAYYHGLARPGERQRYEIFAAWHFAEADGRPTEAALADRFGLSRDQVRYALQEVGKRYERFLRQEVRDQVGPGADLDDEIRGLL
jgi:RNA polymerase sigma factor (sigma-70 family)